VQTLAITGAAGRIGSVLRRGLRRPGRRLVLLDLTPIEPEDGGEDARVIDVRDLSATAAALTGVEGVVHLAGIPTEDRWERILEANIVGTYNVLEAARSGGTRRVVFASTNHVTGFAGVGEDVGPDTPVRPDSLYGVSKSFGESLGRLYADKHGLEVACLRIGSFKERPEEVRDLSTWLSHRDAVSLFAACLAAPLSFEIVYGVSANTRSWWSGEAGARIGFSPQDDAERYAEDVARLGEVYTHQGGPFVG